MTPRSSSASTAARWSTTSTRCRSAASRRSCPTCRRRCRRVGRCRACRWRHPDGHVHGAADRLGRVDRVRAGRSRLSDLGRLLLGQRGGSAGARPAGAAGVAGITLQTTLQNGISSATCPDRPAASCSRAPPARSLIVNDTGINIQNGKGAIDHHGRPDRDGQPGRAGGYLTLEEDLMLMPGFILHVGATVLCTHGGRPAHRAEPARAGQRPAGGDAGGARTLSPAVPSP